jgi:hypothetical protein
MRLGGAQQHAEQKVLQGSIYLQVKLSQPYQSPSSACKSLPGLQ